MDEVAIAVRLLDGASRSRARIAAMLDGSVSVTNETSAETIGLVTWTAATKAEVTELAQLRDRHDGPIVALIDRMPSVRGARAVTVLLDGAVLAEEASHVLMPTLAAVAAGQCVVPRSLRRLLDRPALSPRERQVMAMVVLGFSNAEIAGKLVLTESSVKSHLTSSFAKLGVTSRHAAVDLILDAESGLAPGIIRLSSDD